MNIKEFKLKFIQFKFKALKVLFIAVSLFAEQVYLHGSPDNWGKSMSEN